MLWRACRLPLTVRASRRPLLRHVTTRWAATGHVAISTEAHYDENSSCNADDAYLAKRSLDAPIYRAADLLRDSARLAPYAQREGIKITGIIRSIRKQKHAAFAHISDGSTLTAIQVVLSPELAAGLTNGTFVEIKGKWLPSPAQGQSHELQASAVKIHGPSDPETYPIQKKYQTNEYLRSIPHLRVRMPLNALVNRARAELLSAMSRFLDRSRGHHLNYQVHPPLITSSDCEGAGEVFTVSPREVVPQKQVAGRDSKAKEQHYFKEPKYLTVSSQLHLEAFSAELGHVWALSPTFRAEQSDTPRHLSEFYMYEVELRGVENLQAVMVAVQNGIKLLATKLRNRPVGKELLSFYANRKKQPTEEEVNLQDRWNRLIVGHWKIVTYTDAMNELAKAFRSDASLFQHEPVWKKGLQLEHEKWIVANLGNGKPIFVTHYPKAIKPFYMLPTEAQVQSPEGTQDTQHESETVACFDLLFPFGYCELAGGSLREHRLEHLIQNMREQGMLTKKAASSTADLNETAASPASDYPFLRPGEDLGNLKWYADLRRYGSSPHGGFGMGFDRLLAYLTGVSNVKDVVPFPRTWGRADC